MFTAKTTMKVHELFEDEERSVLSEIGKQPDHFEGNFACSRNKLTSLEGSPSSIGGSFYCNNNHLTSLEGAPPSVGKNFNGSTNRFTSLHNIHKHIKKIGAVADFQGNPIKSHVLGLLLIDGIDLVFLDNHEVRNIINKHLKNGRDVFACQEELIEAGLEEFAQL